MTENNRNNKKVNVKRAYQKELIIRYGTELKLLTFIVLGATALISQAISSIANIDIIGPFNGINFVATFMCVIIGVVILVAISELGILERLLIRTRRLLIWAEKYPKIKGIASFIFRHPIITAVILGIVWATIRAIVRNF